MTYLEQLEARREEFKSRWESLVTQIHERLVAARQDQPEAPASVEERVQQLEELSLRDHADLQGQAELVFVSGGNGVGKDTVMRKSLESGKAVKALNTNTRAIRPDETDGVDSYFWTEEQFQAALSRNEFAWYDLEHHGHPQGLLRQELLDKAHGDKTAYLDALVSTVRTLRQDKAVQNLKSVSVYVLPPSFEAWYQRLTTRSAASPDEDVVERMEGSLKQLENAVETCDVYIVNDQIERAAGVLASFEKQHN